jgi:hypothetical protein
MNMHVTRKVVSMYVQSQTVRVYTVEFHICEQSLNLKEHAFTYIVQ